MEALLRRGPAAVHLSIVRGAAVEPTGDLIEVDVEYAALATLISRLEDLGVDRRGSLSFSDLTDARSPAADEAHARTSSLGTEFILPNPFGRGGAAAMVGLGQARSGAVVGVIVSVTTMPAAANIGVALAFGQGDEAIGALAQLLINLAGMVAAGATTLWVGRRLSRARGPSPSSGADVT